MDRAILVLPLAERARMLNQGGLDGPSVVGMYALEDERGVVLDILPRQAVDLLQAIARIRHARRAVRVQLEGEKGSRRQADEALQLRQLLVALGRRALLVVVRQ